MSPDLFDYLEQTTVSVAEYLELVNGVISPLKPQIEGEVSDFKQTREWIFFSLKDPDEPAILTCGMHVSAYRRIGVLLEDGMSVRISGNAKITPKSGRFNFWVSGIELVGEGALRRAYELLLSKLREEGLFDRKREIPACIKQIGVISSRDGVVIHDLRRNLRPHGILIDFIHTGVEGAAAAPAISGALRYFNTSPACPDVVVIIRGGGSMESLQAFNSEEVCRAVFSCRVPVLVGIGHETDAPIATMVADWSASTPTAVAQVINASWEPIERRVPEIEREIVRTYENRLSGVRHRSAFLIRDIASTFDRLESHMDQKAERMALYAQQIEGMLKAAHEKQRILQRSLTAGFTQRLRRAFDAADLLEQKLRLVDPERTLARGFALAYDGGGKLIRSSKAVKSGELMRIRVVDGSIAARVEDINEER